MSDNYIASVSGFWWQRPLPLPRPPLLPRSILRRRRTDDSELDFVLLRNHTSSVFSIISKDFVVVVCLSEPDKLDAL